MKKSIMNPQLAQEDGKNYENRIPMRYWAEDDLPSQKLLLKGNSSLSDAELLSIIIGSGVSGENSLDIAMKILSICGNNLCEFWKFAVSDLLKIKGIGQKRAIKLAAMFALARRRNESEVIIKKKIAMSRDAFVIFQSLMGDLPHEEFWILLLNRANRVLSKIRISEGGISGTVVDPKKLFNICLVNHASAIILGHNHPSGNTQPSDADNKLTIKLRDAGLLLDISVMDHIIVGDEGYYSYADEGKM